MPPAAGCGGAAGSNVRFRGSAKVRKTTDSHRDKMAPGRGFYEASPSFRDAGPLAAIRNAALAQPTTTSPIAPASYWVKNSRPSANAAMQRAPLFEVGMSYSPRTVPSGAMQPILLAKFAVYQRSPATPTATPRSEALGVGTGC